MLLITTLDSSSVLLDRLGREVFCNSAEFAELLSSVTNLMSGFDRRLNARPSEP